MISYKIETHTHIVTWFDNYVVIEEKDSDEEPIIKELDELSTIHKATINSIYPIVEWIIKEIKNGKKRKTSK